MHQESRDIFKNNSIRDEIWFSRQDKSFQKKKSVFLGLISKKVMIFGFFKLFSLKKQILLLFFQIFLLFSKLFSFKNHFSQKKSV